MTPNGRILRPTDTARQKAKYSGKKKRHTRKNNVITDKRTGKVKGLRPTVEGKRHDKKLADEQDGAFPPGFSLGPFGMNSASGTLGVSRSNPFSPSLVPPHSYRNRTG